MSSLSLTRPKVFLCLLKLWTVCAFGIQAVRLVSSLCIWRPVCAFGIQSGRLVSSLCVWCPVCAFGIQAVRLVSSLCVWCPVCAFGVQSCPNYVQRHALIYTPLGCTHAVCERHTGVVCITNGSAVAAS